MASSELNDVAWDLVEQCRTSLTASELNTAFVRLGVGEYNEAMAVALRSVIGKGGPPLPPALLAQLRRLHQVYYFEPEFAALLDAVAQVRPAS